MGKPKDKCKKICFHSKVGADNFVRDFEHEPEQTSTYVPVRSYFCQECSAWHVTSKERHWKKRLRPYSRKGDHGKLFLYGQKMLQALTKKQKKKKKKPK